MAASKLPVRLSDGTLIKDVPFNDPSFDTQGFIRSEEAKRDTINMQTAQTNKGPFTPTWKDDNGNLHEGTKTYSATSPYANNWAGHSQAWLDHNLGGNQLVQGARALDTATGGALSNPYGPVQTGARVMTNKVGGGLDMVGGGINMLRNTLGNPAEKAQPDIPSATEGLQQAFHIAPLPADASLLRQFGEGALSSASLANMVRTGIREGPAALIRPTARAAGWTAGGMGLGYGGQQIAGDPGGYVGSLIGSGAFLPGGRALAAGIGQHFRNERAQPISQSFQNLGVEPSFTSLSNPSGQRVASVLGSLPWAGAPIEGANARVSSGLQAVRDDVSQQLAGGTLPTQDPTRPYGNQSPGPYNPITSSPATIGADIIQGARESAPVLAGRVREQWDPIHSAMEGRSAPLAPVISAVEESLQRNPPSVGTEAAIRDSLSQVASMAPGGANYNVSRQGPAPPLPSQDMPVPFSALKEYKSGLYKQLGEGAIDPKDLTLGIINRTSRDALRTATQDPATGLPPGQYDRARATTQQLQPFLDQLYEVGGRPAGPIDENQPASPANTQYTTSSQLPPKEATAYDIIHGNRQSPSAIEPFADPNLFSPDAWHRATGGYISTLGNTSQGGFRPEALTDKLSPKEIDPDVLQMMTEGRPDLHQNLLDLANAGSNYSTPTSRFGLIKSLGTGAAVHSLLHYLGGVGSDISAPLAVAAPTLVARGMSMGLESQPVKQAQAGPTPYAGPADVSPAERWSQVQPSTSGPAITQSVYNTLPSFAALQEVQNQRIDAQRRLQQQQQQDQSASGGPAPPMPGQ